MRIISFAAIRNYAKSTLMLMYLCVIGIKTEKADWSCLADTKQTFNSVDYVGNDRFVFNIKGNDYRLVAMILFAAKKYLSVG